MSELTNRLRAYEPITRPLPNGPMVRGWNHMVQNSAEAAFALDEKERIIERLISNLNDIRAILDNAAGEKERVDASTLKYWSKLISFSIEKANAENSNE